MSLDLAHYSVSSRPNEENTSQTVRARAQERVERKAVVTWPCRVSSVSSRPRDSVEMARLGSVQGHQDGGQVSLVTGYLDVDKTGFESVAD